MFTIQSVLLVLLGFLAATLIALLSAPAFWSRAVRITSRRVREQLPVSEREIAAEKDRLRAEHALQVYRLEQQIEKNKLSGARQLIEINRREASLGQIRSEAEQLRQTLEETLNARRVLEQTVADRLPRVEQRLSEAKNLLFARDREILELTRTAETQTRALAEAGSINHQHQAEIERLLGALAARSSRSDEGPSDPRFDGEVALRSELEALRAKARDQSSVISRLQSQFAAPGGMRGNLETPPSGAKDVAPASLNGDQENGARLRSQEEYARDQAAHAELQTQLRVLKSRTEDQAGEITRLRAAIAVFEGGDDQLGSGMRDSRIALRAKLGSVEALAAQQSDTIQSLRAELAAANERMARQAAHFMNEMRRLGAGTLPASGQARRPRAAVTRQTLAERVAQTASQPSTQAAPPGRQDPPVQASAGVAAEERLIASAREPAIAHSVEASAANGSDDRQPRAKPRLLDRITSITKSPES